MPPPGAAAAPPDGEEDVILLATPAHLNINKISREVRAGRPCALARPAAERFRRSPLADALSRARAQLRRTDLSLHNCLLSIDADARFVARLARRFPALPVVANLRCGAWYTPAPDATAYFKVSASVGLVRLARARHQASGARGALGRVCGSDD